MSKPKKAVAAFIIALWCMMLLSFCQPVDAAESSTEIDYLQLMKAAAVDGDAEQGLAEESARDAKIEREGLSNIHISWEDLYYLSKIMTSEAGSDWLSDEWKMSVGEVVLNRVASPAFPDTVREVILQKGQYAGANSQKFKNLHPSWRCVELALRLLEGERVLNCPSVLYQSNEPQGKGIYVAYHDRYLGWTYFCYG